MNNELLTAIAAMDNAQIEARLKALHDERKQHHDKFLEEMKRIEAEYVQWRETTYREERNALLAQRKANAEAKRAKKAEAKVEAPAAEVPEAATEEVTAEATAA